MSLLAEPRVNEILTGSRLRDALADEAVLHLLADQATLVQAVRSPQNLRGVVPDGFFQLLADPVVQRLLTNPRIYVRCHRPGGPGAGYGRPRAGC